MNPTTTLMIVSCLGGIGIALCALLPRWRIYLAVGLLIVMIGLLTTSYLINQPQQPDPPAPPQVLCTFSKADLNGKLYTWQVPCEDLEPRTLPGGGLTPLIYPWDTVTY